MDENDEYGEIADEDLIRAVSQDSQILPELPRLGKRRREGGSGRRASVSSTSSVSDDEGGEEEGPRAKRIRSRMIYNGKDVPAAKIVAATQAEELEALPDSSPYRIRGPIYRKPRSPNEVTPDLSPNRDLPRSQRSDSTIHRHQPFEPSFGEEIENIPPELLMDDEDEEFGILQTSAFLAEKQMQDNQPRQRLIAVQQGLKQTTLFGDRATQTATASQAKKVHNYIVDRSPEPPTHHRLEKENLKTWTYPLNLGKIRDYQYSIVRHALFHNTLVALPTGLGKTCIAATIMLNFFRWTTNSQIVFVAPTKPLVAQQVDACFNIVGIPKSQTTLLTGEQPPTLRAEEWETKRVFFMTPQTLDNDLRTGIADPKKIVLLVVDEAHRAKGNYAYVKVVELLRRFNKSFRVLALTATPGADVEAVQEVIDNLEISKVEIRTEESIDIQQYVHRRNIEQIILDPSDEMNMCKELLGKALQPLVNQLCAQNAYYNKDPMSLTAFGMMQARKSWFASPAGRAAPQPVKGMMNALFAVLASIAHSIKLLNFHGITPFYDKIRDFRNESEASKNGGGKYRKQILENADFRTMVDRIQMWTSNPDFVGHPKLTFLCDAVLNHFLDAGAGRLGEDAPPSSTRVIVFAEFRDSAETITKVLNRHGPMVRASVFVGQADSKRSEGMKQSQQIETVENFKKGKINVLVATSIGEEGLDIGQVDLIVCYDASSSPIRMLQRMGRTGRKRAGKIVLLLMRGKEETSFAKAKDNYEKMQKLISSGNSFAMRNDLSVRILPRDVVPEVDKRIIEIPLENTQDPSLPEPRRRQSGKKRKRPEKKFHMPDGVHTGFQKASDLTNAGKTLDDMGIISVKKRSAADITVALTPIVPTASVLLGPVEEDTLQRQYLNISGTEMAEVSMPDVTIFPTDQRALAPIVNVQHGPYTKRCIELFNRIGQKPATKFEYIKQLSNEELNALAERIVPAVVDEVEIIQVLKKKRAQSKARTVVRYSPVGQVEGGEEARLPPSKKPIKRRKQARLRDSEGEGDDLANSEELSQDSDDGGSLQDFIISSKAATSSLICSSSSPPPINSRRRVCDLDLVTENGNSDNTDDGEITPIQTRRGAHRRIVEESEDSDE